MGLGGVFNATMLGLSLLGGQKKEPAQPDAVVPDWSAPLKSPQISPERVPGIKLEIAPPPREVTRPLEKVVAPSHLTTYFKESTNVYPQLARDRRDPLAPEAVRRVVHEDVARRVALHGGVLKDLTPNSTVTHTIPLGPKDIRHSADIAEALTRTLINTRIAAGVQKDQLTNVPTEAEMSGALVAFLKARQQAGSQPIILRTALCSDETQPGLDGKPRNVFGTTPERQKWNDVAKAHGVPGLENFTRKKADFFTAVIDTPPVRQKSGDLINGIGFNGHGLKGGKGLISSGDEVKTAEIVSSAEWIATLDKHFEKHQALYQQAKKAGCRSELSIVLAACYSHDFVRNNDSGESILEAAQRWSDKHGVHIAIVVATEFGQPGTYRPSPTIEVSRDGEKPERVPESQDVLDVPVDFLRDLHKIGVKSGSKLTVGSTYNPILSGQDPAENMSNSTTFYISPGSKWIQLSMNEFADKNGDVRA